MQISLLISPVEYYGAWVSTLNMYIFTGVPGGGELLSFAGVGAFV